MLLSAAALAGCFKKDSHRQVPRNVLIYLVDTLRAEHLGIYGYGRNTSPRLDELSRSAVVFDQAYSNSPWTRTSVVTLFTGLYPSAHGVHDRDDVAPDALDMMAEGFRRAGYETAGFSSNVSVSERFNLAQGFDRFTYFDPKEYFAGRNVRSPGYVPVAGMVPAIEKWLDRPHERPFFLYVHTTDPHARYSPPASYRRWQGLTGQIEQLIALYDGEVLYSDDYFGRLIGLLKRKNLLDETLVILTADHGEELGDRTIFGHGHTLYNELLRVPLVLRHPALTPGRREETVLLLDVLPTLVEWLDLPFDHDALQGRSLLPLLMGADTAPDHRFVLGDVRYPSKIVAKSLQMDGLKLIHTVQDRTGKRDAWELYDLTTDPAERNNRAADSPKRLAEYRRRLDNLHAATARAVPSSSRATLDEKTERNLRALGYVQ